MAARFSTKDWERLGFESKEQMIQAVTDLDLSSPEARDWFRAWKRGRLDQRQAGRLRHLTKAGTAHYRTVGPTIVSFSGGRTSGYLLWMIIQSHGGRLPDDVRVVFTNTGKERPQTLDFIHRIEQEWGVDIHWVEWRPPAPGRPPSEASYERVDRSTAFVSTEPSVRPSGLVRPFDALILSLASYRRTKGDGPILPGMSFRLCTAYLKIKTSAKYVRDTFGWDQWESLIGLRADEPERVANIRLAPLEGGSEPFTPLSDAGVTESDVMEFWRTQSFDLGLRQGEGNCDLCYLKNIPLLLSLMKERPEEARWWIEQEQKAGSTFRKRPSYEQLLERSRGLTQETIQEMAPHFPPTIPCTCTD